MEASIHIGQHWAERLTQKRRLKNKYRCSRKHYEWFRSPRDDVIDAGKATVPAIPFFFTPLCISSFLPSFLLFFPHILFLLTFSQLSPTVNTEPCHLHFTMIE